MRIKMINAVLFSSVFIKHFLRRYHEDEKRSGAGGPPIPFSSIVR